MGGQEDTARLDPETLLSAPQTTGEDAAAVGAKADAGVDDAQGHPLVVTSTSKTLFKTFAASARVRAGSGLAHRHVTWMRLAPRQCVVVNLCARFIPMHR